MKTIFKKIFSHKHPRKRFIYAVTGGKYLGELLVYIKQEDDDYKFITLPEMKNRSVPTTNFSFGLKENIVDTVQKLPHSVYKMCVLQYKKNVEINAWAH